MRILAVGLDRALLEERSSSRERQKRYYANDEADIVVLVPGASKTVRDGSVAVYAPGGRNKPMALWRGIRLARRLARKHRIELATGQDPWWSGLVAYFASRASGAAFHLQDHSAAFAREPFGRAERWMRPVSRFLVRRARRIRTVSERGKRGLVTAGVAPTAIDVIPIGGDLPSEIPSAHAFRGRLLYVGRLAPEKGVDILLNAFASVRSPVPLTLDLVGDGPERGTLERLARDLGIADRVRFVGWQNDVMSYYAEADIAIQPSWFEGWGRTLIDAAAVGLPIVTTDVGCVGDVLRPDDDALVVRPGDAAAMARAVERLVEDAGLRVRLGSSATMRVRDMMPPAAELERRVRDALERTLRPRLLVTIQAVDLDDPLMGFFHTWLDAASGTFGTLTVLALRTGRFRLPPNVDILPLRPSGSRSRLVVVWRLWRESWHRRHGYDAVFVRGDVQYVIAGAWLWRLLGKRIFLWFAHYRPNRLLYPASLLAHEVVSSVPEACTHPRVRATFIGQGIPSERFAPASHPGRPPRFLVFGRVMESKRVLEILDAFHEAAGGRAELEIVGPAADPAYESKVRGRLASVPGAAWTLTSVPYDDVPSFLSGFDAMVNAYPASLDKSIVEGMMAGLPVVAATDAVRPMLSPEDAWLHATDHASRVSAIRRIIGMSPDGRRTLGLRLRNAAVERHALSSQIGKLMNIVVRHWSSVPESRFLRKVTGVAFVIRLALFAVILLAVGEKGLWFPDTKHYVGLATSVLSGAGYVYEGQPFGYRTPGYPAFVALGLGAFGSLAVVSFLQLLIASFLPWMGYRAARSLGATTWTARATAWALALEPHAVYYSVPLLADALLAVSFAAFLLIALRAFREPSFRGGVIAGALFGLHLLVKPVLQLGLVVIPAFFVAVASVRRRAAYVALAVGLAFSSAAVLAPWILRNASVFGVPALSSQGGFALVHEYLVPSIISVRDGISFDEAEKREDAYLERTYGIRPAEQADLHNTGVLRGVSLSLIRSEPFITTKILALNTFTLWTSHTYAYIPFTYGLIPAPDASIQPFTHLLIQGRVTDAFRSLGALLAQPFWSVGIAGRVLWVTVFLLSLVGLVRALFFSGEHRAAHVFVFLLISSYTAAAWVNGLGIEARLRYPLLLVQFMYAASGYEWIMRRKAYEHDA